MELKNEGHVPMPNSVEQLKLLLMRWNALQNRGIALESHSEFNEINKTLNKVAKQQEDYRERLEKLKTLRKTRQTQNQNSGGKDLLRAQVQSLKLLSRNVDVPEELQAVLKQSLNTTTTGGDSSNGKISNNKKNQNGDYQDEPPVLPNDFKHRTRRAGVSGDPSGSSALVVDGKQKKNCSVGGTAETIIRNRLTYRMVELECLPANLGAYKVGDVDELVGNDEIKQNSDDLKLKALIELKALRVLTKQKSLRQALVLEMANSSELKMIKDRTKYRLKKVQTAQEMRLTEQLERRQHEEREKKEYAKKIAKIRLITDQSEQMLDELHQRRQQQQQLSRSIAMFHRETEKEESKRSEKTAKQRLQALRANDEEAYIKLLDQTKDTRITHLLSQTNTFLKSLSAAVRVQQQDSGLSVEEEEDGEQDYYKIAHRIHETVVKQPSILVGGELKEYQIRGLEWMVSLYNNNLNGILADEMGLGKTIQSISLITHLIENKNVAGPFLVIVPLSTMANWNLEFEKWSPSVKRVVYKGPPNARKAQQAVIRTGDFQVLLTTYEYIIKDRFLLSKIKWAHMIIDEGHRMKNAQSKLSYTLTTYYSSKHRLILTGTPLQNNLPELWALLNFVLPNIFNSAKTFDEWFNTPFANTGGQDKMELTEEETLLIIRRLHKVLRPFLLRRLKKDVEKDLPDKTEKVLKCKMSALQMRLYNQMLQYNVLYVGNRQAGGTGKTNGSIKGLNNKIMQLRKICNHPYVFEEVETMVNPSKMNNDELWRTAGKFELLDRILPKFKATGHRVLIFFQMTQVMDIMEDYLRLKGLQYLRLDGSTKAEERSDMLKLFNAPDSPYFAFLLSTRAGGLGLNLQTADTVIIYDTDWNPHQDLQAQDRAHRIGQTKEVRILRLITESSIEEMILERAHAKLEIDGKVIQAGKFDNKSTSEEQEAFLRSLLEAEEAKKAGRDDDDDMDDDELNTILARNDDELITFKDIDNDRIKNGLYGKNKGKDRLFSSSELPEEYPEDLQEQLKGEKSDEVLGRGARERKSIMYDDGLTEEQWLDAVDDDDDTIENAIERKRQRSARRASKLSSKLRELGENDDDDDDDDHDDHDHDDGQKDNDNDENGNGNSNGRAELEHEEIATPVGKRKRGRSARFSDIGSAGDQDEIVRPAKRAARKSSSATPRASSPGTVSSPAAAAADDAAGKVSEQARALIDAFSEAKDDEGRNRAELFMSLPSKKLYPDYYSVIAAPIALNGIKKKLKKNEYSSVQEVKSDFDQMLANAQQYNEQGSFVYEDAEALRSVVEETYKSVAPKKSTPKIRLKM